MQGVLKKTQGRLFSLDERCHGHQEARVPSAPLFPAEMSEKEPPSSFLIDLPTADPSGPGIEHLQLVPLPNQESAQMWPGSTSPPTLSAAHVSHPAEQVSSSDDDEKTPCTAVHMHRCFRDEPISIIGSGKLSNRVTPRRGMVRGMSLGEAIDMLSSNQGRVRRTVSGSTRVTVENSRRACRGHQHTQVS
jgi:hypothetical protein